MEFTLSVALFDFLIIISQGVHMSAGRWKILLENIIYYELCLWPKWIKILFQMFFSMID